MLQCLPMKHSTVSLIGMPGAGKSSVGVLLAKELGMNFVDSDLVIQVRHEATLQQILEAQGHLVLRQFEEEVLLELPLHNTLLATGGSAVYSPAAMQRLRDCGPIVFIDVPLELLTVRVDNESSRGIAKEVGQDFAGVFAERQPLYQHYADITLAGDELSAQATARLLAARLLA
jgi:shikimate kinase